MKTPSFRHMGGKARLRTWLLRHFPQDGNRYIELFAGKGNVFFAAKKELQFSQWQLNDVDNEFLQALKGATNLELLPETVSREDFSKWREDRSPLSKILEPRITFAGKGYKYGYSGTSGTHVGYHKFNYIPLCYEARKLLIDAKLASQDWAVFLDSITLEPNDFLYCDPPYLNTSASYSNIDHELFIQRLNSLNTRWAASAYQSELYDKSLEWKNRYMVERNSEIKSSNNSKFSSVIEVLYTNY